MRARNSEMCFCALLEAPLNLLMVKRQPYTGQADNTLKRNAPYALTAGGPDRPMTLQLLLRLIPRLEVESCWSRARQERWTRLQNHTMALTIALWASPDSRNLGASRADEQSE